MGKSPEQEIDEVTKIYVKPCSTKYGSDKILAYILICSITSEQFGSGITLRISSTACIASIGVAVTGGSDTELPPF